MRAAELAEYLKTALTISLSLNLFLGFMVFWLVRGDGTG